jgi:uncharacterized protein YjdB
MRHLHKIDWPISLSLLFACVLTVIAACVEPSGPLGAPNVIQSEKVSSVQITLAQSALAPGQTTQATAVARSASGQIVTGRIDFSSQDTTIAKVSSNGVVTALAPGIVLIQAAIAGCVGETSVMVKALLPTVAVVSVALDSTSLLVGHSAKATAIAKDSVGGVITGESASWASQSPNIATVSSDGTVTAVAAGLAKIQATVAGKVGVASLAVVQGSSAPVASVAVAIDSITLLVGHVGHALATPKDAAGNIVTNATVTWTSLTPTVATVSASGAVTAVAEGSAIIRATASGIAGDDSLVVVVPPDLASQNFDGGSYSPYVNFWDPVNGGNGDVDLVDDPSGAGKGKVARMHYAGTNQDRNRFLEYDHGLTWGHTIFFRGEFYVDVPDFGDGFWGRKLWYFLSHVDYQKYGGGPTFNAVVGFQGHGLYVDGGYVSQSGIRTSNEALIATLLPRTWYTLEIQTTAETSIGAGNGILRIWLNGALIYEKTDYLWTDPAWIGQPIPGGNGTPLELADVYLERVEVGEQLNLIVGSFNEYRYWDKVAFSTKRIGN